MFGLHFSSSMSLSFRLEQVLCIKDMQVWQGIAQFGWDTVFVQTLHFRLKLFSLIFVGWDICNLLNLLGCLSSKFELYDKDSTR